MIIGPDGTVLVGPLHGEEGILYAEIDVALARASRREFDPIGHYARPDIFTLTVDVMARQPVNFVDEPPSSPPTATRAVRQPTDPYG